MRLFFFHAKVFEVVIMKKVLLYFIIIVAIVVGVYLYDGYKPIPSSWSVRAYFALRDDALTRFVKQFSADMEVKSIALHSPDDVSFDLFSEVQAEYQLYRRRIIDEYALTLQETTVFGVTPCGMWFKQNEYILCAGVPPLGHVYLRSSRASNISFLLKYWPSGVSTDNQCSSISTPNEFGVCELILSENWSIHYEWFDSPSATP